MATTSEIQVTEAYIGLLGRAPDPSGLAYWTAQLDAAIAAGQSASDALKKLTNDITLSAEWDAGIGANDATTQSGAEAVVSAMYLNLFERAATTSDLAYWSAELVNGTTSASEMAVQLIVAAQANSNTTDADVLGYKQEAATYYVENVTQEQFDRTSAGSAVDPVDGPKTLDASKTATDYISSGVGETYALTASTTDAPAMTAGSDTVTGTFGTDATFQSTDTILDTSTSDADTLTLSGDNAGLAIEAANITNIETVNLNLSKTVGSGFTVTMTNDLSADTFNIDVADKVTVAGLEVDGETVVSVTGGDLVGNINTTDVTSLTLAGLGNNKTATTITGDADLASVTISGEANDAGVTLDLANNDTTVAITGGGAGNDMATIKANGDVALTLTNMEFLNVEGNSGAVDVAITTGADKYTLSGSQDITISGDAAIFNDSTLVNNATGTTTVDITSDTTDLDIGSFANVSMLDLSTDMQGRTVTLDDGQAVTISAAQGGTLQFLDDGRGNDATLAITVDGGTANTLAVGTIETNDFGVVTINSGADTMTSLAVDATLGNDAALTVVSTNDVSGSALSAKSVTVDVGDLTLTGAVASSAGNISLTSDEGVAATTVAATGGSVTITADTADITTQGITAGTGKDLSLTAVDMAVTGNLAGDDISLAASNDSVTNTAESISGNITAANDINITDGTFTAANMTATAGSITISGDAGITVSTATAAADNIVVTSSGNVDLSATDTRVLVGTAATGNITAEFTTPTTAEAITIATGTGNDSLTLDNDNVFTVTTGDGVDNVVMTTVKAGSSVNTGDGADVVTMNDVGIGTVVNTGAGDDSISMNETVLKSTVATGEGNDTVTFTGLNGNDIDISFGDGTDTLVLAAGDMNGSVTWSDVEKVNIVAGSATINSTQLAGDNVFELVGNSSNTLTIVSADGNDTVINAGSVTTGFGTDAALNITGAGGNDTLTGNVTANTISGNGGADTINGGGSRDVLNGGAGDDTLNGGDVGDDLTGGLGADVLNGDAGNDYIRADDGIDTMTGGDGNDTFIISVMTSDSSANESLALSQAHTITDFDGTHAGDNDVLSIQHANDAGTNNDSAVDGSSYDDIGDVITAANTYFSSDGAGAADTNDVFLAWNAYGSGNAILLVDDDNDGVFEDGETMIILTGINTQDEANNVIDSLDLGS